MRDEQLYLIAYNDFGNNEIDQAIWIKAMAKANGEKKTAKWYYVEFRVEQMLRDPALKKSLLPFISPSSSSSGAYMIWLSVFIFFGVLVMGIGFDFRQFTFDPLKLLMVTDLPSFLFVFPQAIIFGIASTSWKSYWRCWTYPFFSKKNVSAEDARSSVLCLKVMGNTGLVMGLIGTFIGLLLVLRESREIENFAPFISICLVTTFYGIICKITCYVAEQRVRNLYLNS